MTSAASAPPFQLSWPTRAQAEKQAREPSDGVLVLDPERSFQAAKVTSHEVHNLFIEGDNLDVLRILSRDHPGEVDVIVTDPPYNTGGAFAYHDNFTTPLTEYLDLTGTKHRDRSAEAGRLHDAWLSFMYPRLVHCHRLLADHGVFAISIDDNEMANLKIILDEIFGPACFKNAVITRRGTKNVQAQFPTAARLAVGHEYLLIYTKDPDTRLAKLEVPKDKPTQSSWNNHWRGTNRPTMRYPLLGNHPTHGQWRWAEPRSLAAYETYQRLCEELGTPTPTQRQVDKWYAAHSNGERLDLLRANPNTGKPEHYVPGSATKLGSDVWTDLPATGTSELKALFGSQVFDAPKPTALIKRLLDITLHPSHRPYQVVLDPFTGSGTTGHAVLTNSGHGFDRRFWLVQAPEKIDTRTGSQAVKMGLHTIADVARERLVRVIASDENLKNTAGFQYYRYSRD